MGNAVLRHGKKLAMDFTSGKIVPQMLRFSWPLILSNLLQMAYNFVDMAIVGQFLGSSGLSAVSNGGDVIHFATVLCTGFAGAGQVLIAQSLGRRDREGVQKSIGTTFTFLAIIAVVLMTVGLCFTDWALNLLNVPLEAYADTRSYVRICLWGMIFVFGYNAVASTLRGLGDSVHPFCFILLASVLNLVLDLVFVLVFHLGVAGAALATVIGESVSFIACLIFLYRNKEGFGFDFRLNSFGLDKEVFPKLVKLGVPMALQHSAVSLSKLFVTSFINSYGLVFSAINGIGSKLIKCANVVCNALNTCTTSMVGQCKGAGKAGRIRKIVYTALLICAAYCAVMVLCLALLPEQIFGLFNREPEILDACHIYVPILMLTFMLAGLRQPMTALVNGMGRAELALVNVIFGSILCRAGLSYLLGEVLGYGYTGFWLGECLADVVPFLIGGTFFWSGAWKRSVDTPREEPLDKNK